MVKFVGRAYPWDVLGDPEFVARARQIGVDSVALAAAYHSTRAATPLHPRRKLVDAAHSALYRPVRETAWAHERLRPEAAQWMSEADPFAAAVEALRREGLAVSAWIVLTHNLAVGAAAPDVTVVNCFDERYLYALCPSQAEVRDYCARLSAEALREVDVDEVALEACGQLGVEHGGSHDKTAGAWSQEAAQLLSICCCAACQTEWSRRGLHPATVVAQLRQAVHGHTRGLPEPVCESTMQTLLECRHAAADALRTQVLTEVRRTAPDVSVTLHAHPDPWAVGAAPGLTATAAGEVDELLVPAWPTTVDSAAVVADTARSGTSVSAYVTALEPVEPTALPAHARRLVDAGAQRLDLYHLGLAPLSRQRLLAQIVEELG